MITKEEYYIIHQVSQMVADDFNKLYTEFLKSYPFLSKVNNTFIYTDTGAYTLAGGQPNKLVISAPGGDRRHYASLLDWAKKNTIE